MARAKKAAATDAAAEATGATAPKGMAESVPSGAATAEKKKRRTKRGVKKAAGAQSVAPKVASVKKSTQAAPKVKRKRRKGKKPATAAASTVAPGKGEETVSGKVKFSLETLLAAKKLAESLGGVEAARAAIAALAKLTR